MVSKKYSQFVKHIMQNAKPDTEKLITIASFIRRNYKINVHREKILLFDKKTGHLKGHYDYITEQQFHKYVIHVPDLIFFINSKLHILEIDGSIHDTSTSVARKDRLRNEAYETALIPHEIINEWEVLAMTGCAPNRSASPYELIPEIKKRMEKILELNSATAPTN